MRVAADTTLRNRIIRLRFFVMVFAVSTAFLLAVAFPQLQTRVATAANVAPSASPTTTPAPDYSAVTGSLSVSGKITLKSERVLIAASGTVNGLPGPSEPSWMFFYTVQPQNSDGEVTLPSGTKLWAKAAGSTSVTNQDSSKVVVRTFPRCPLDEKGQCGGYAVSTDPGPVAVFLGNANDGQVHVFALGMLDTLGESSCNAIVPFACQ